MTLLLNCSNRGIDRGKEERPCCNRSNNKGHHSWDARCQYEIAGQVVLHLNSYQTAISQL